MCSPLAVAKRAKAIQVGMVHNSGLELAGGGDRWIRSGLTREEGGRGEGERRGWEEV
jgi:hypothetical protein